MKYYDTILVGAKMFDKEPFVIRDSQKDRMICFVWPSNVAAGIVVENTLHIFLKTGRSMEVSFFSASVAEKALEALLEVTKECWKYGVPTDPEIVGTNGKPFEVSREPEGESQPGWFKCEGCKCLFPCGDSKRGRKTGKNLCRVCWNKEGR